MTIEQSILVAVHRTDAVAELVRDILSARERSEKADPGDRSDVVRYEALCVRLEDLAEQALAAGARAVALPQAIPSSIGYSFDDVQIATDPLRLSRSVPGDLAQTVNDWATVATVVELRRGLEVGETPGGAVGQPAADPAAPWRAEGNASGSRAVQQRFRSQIEAVIAAAGNGTHSRGDSINPSGVNNRIITETLRQFVVGSAGETVPAPVTYRDGSTASHPFRLRSLPLSSHLPRAAPDLELHLTLLSIRHTEMDPVVDGAWLRNAEVSRPRPAALTDDFVYETSRTQLRHITNDGRLRVVLNIYQTGLDTAVVGFYRSVVDHLIEFPGSLSVVPMFFAASQQSQDPASAPFRPSRQPWTLGDQT
jgi:hypothetical protein